MSGFFLTIEGCEGAGKSTAVNLIKEWMSEKGIEFTETREPGGTRVAEDIRGILLSHHGEALSDTTELLLMFAARSQNLFHNIEPGMKADKVVICDRFTDATYAYQGGGRGLDQQQIATLENLVQGERRPDMTLLMDVDPEVGMARARGRGELDRIEQEKMDFFERVRDEYLSRSRMFPQQYEVINAGDSLESVKQQILSVLERRLATRMKGRI